MIFQKIKRSKEKIIHDVIIEMGQSKKTLSILKFINYSCGKEKCSYAKKMRNMYLFLFP